LLRHLDALGEALVEGLLDFGAHHLLDGVAQPAAAVHIDAVRLQQTLQREHGSDDFAVAGRGQPADDIAHA
jgi:hypothetical protein